MKSKIAANISARRATTSLAFYNIAIIEQLITNACAVGATGIIVPIVSFEDKAELLEAGYELENETMWIEGEKSDVTHITWF